MRENLIVSSPQAYGYPLLIKQLLTNSLSLYGDQEITYRGEFRYTYRDFRRRVGQLASALEDLGVRHGTTVAVMDWDSHRYLESYFAIPMMGATLFTVNVRLAPQQIAYTLNDSGAEIVLVHADFVPLLEDIKDELKNLRSVVVLADGEAVPANTLAVAGEYEALVGAASPDFQFGDFDENTKAATFYTTGTTGDPKGVYYSHRQIVLHTMATALALSAPRAGQRIHREDVYMPITPMFHVLAWGMPFIAVTLGLKTVLPGRYLPEVLLQAEAVGEGHVFALRADHSADAAAASRQVEAGSRRLDNGHRRRGASARAVQSCPRKGHRRLRRLRHVRDRSGRLGRADSARCHPGRRGRRRPPPLAHRTAGALRRSPRRRRSDARRAARRHGRRARSSCARRPSRRVTSTSRRPQRSCGTVATCTRRTSP